MNANEPSNTQLMQRGMTLAMYYIAQTQTLKIVQRQYGQISGHWLALIYRFTSKEKTPSSVASCVQDERCASQNICNKKCANCLTGAKPFDIKESVSHSA